MKYDDASWHYEGTFPADLPQAAGATHIGMFVAWMLINDLFSEEMEEDFESEIAQVKERSMTGAQSVISALDEKLTDEDLSDLGNAFAVAYYEGLDKDSRYIDDYLKTFSIGVDNLYGVEDSWANYERLATAMDARFAAWNSAGQPEHIV